MNIIFVWITIEGFARKNPAQFADLGEYEFESAWRSCSWTLDAERSQLLDQHKEKGFNASSYLALRSLSEGDSNFASKTLSEARMDVLKARKKTQKTFT